MAVILVVVHKKGLRGFGGMAVGAMVVLDILFLRFISGASMNAARSLETVRISTRVITKVCTRLLFIGKLQKRDSINHLHMCPFLFIMSIEQEKSPTLLFSW